MRNQTKAPGFCCILSGSSLLSTAAHSKDKGKDKEKEKEKVKEKEKEKEKEEQKQKQKQAETDKKDSIMPKPLEEEKTNWCTPHDWYPVQIGQLFNRRYEVLCKLGYGGTSTIWLAKDLE